jgi:Family of unknown function (DUF6491)
MIAKFDWLKRGAVGALALTVGLTLGSAAVARSKPEVRDVEPGAGYEQVDSIPMLTRPHSWTALDNDTLIVWATPFQPYLVELAFPSHDLRFDHAIGLTQSGSRVYAKFDAVKVRGFRYPIDSIYKLTRDEAKNLARSS